MSILSTVPMNNYAQFTGTSMASPHIAGGAALVYSQSSGLTPTEVKARILNAVDLVPTLNGITVTGGRLNVTKALQQQPGLCTPPASGDWVISANCTLEGNATAPANVIVEENVALTIASGVALDISLSSYHLKIKKGAKVVVKNGGKIY